MVYDERDLKPASTQTHGSVGRAAPAALRYALECRPHACGMVQAHLHADFGPQRHIALRGPSNVRSFFCEPAAMSGAKGLPVAAISRRPTQDGDAAVLGRSDELKMKARMRARFWEENDEQTDERVALDHIEGFDQRREEKEKKQTLEKREEERLQRQKQKAGSNTSVHP